MRLPIMVLWFSGRLSSSSQLTLCTHWELYIVASFRNSEHVLSVRLDEWSRMSLLSHSRHRIDAV